MSKIIKGGKVRFFCFDYERASSEEEECFNPLEALLPPEALEVIEELRKEEETEEPESEFPSAPPEEAAQEEGEPEETEEPKPLDLSEVPLEELLSHPEVAAKISGAEAEAREKGFKEGYQEGFQQGLKEGEAKGEEKYATKYSALNQQLESLIQSLQKEIEDHFLALESQVLSLVRALAEAVLNREVSISDEVLETSVRTALGYLKDQTRVRIHINPDDADFFEEVLSKMKDELAHLKDIEVVPDAKVGRGGCVLETDFGLVDATIERRWREALKLLRLEEETEDEGA